MAASICRHCVGTGEFEDRPCGWCSGTGDEDVEVKSLESDFWMDQTHADYGFRDRESA